MLLAYPLFGALKLFLLGLRDFFGSAMRLTVTMLPADSQSKGGLPLPQVDAAMPL